MKMPALMKTKTFWTGLTAIVAGAGMCYLGDKERGIQTILGGLAVIFLRDGVKTEIAKATADR
ncbi:MAG: hypothetical protein WC551_11955 [Patescibacteria group bacterium]